MPVINLVTVIKQAADTELNTTNIAMPAQG
jgi:hypothetical protein